MSKENQKLKKRVYIAGKVSGQDRMECAAKFKRAANKVKKLGFEAVNPLEAVGTWDISWENAMRKALTALLTCDGIWPLNDAAFSRGATLEVEIAVKLGLKNFKDMIKK